MNKTTDLLISLFNTNMIAWVEFWTLPDQIKSFMFSHEPRMNIKYQYLKLYWAWP